MPERYYTTKREGKLCSSSPAYKARTPYAEHNCNSAFTLIELSIVLVIIGLIVGGVLVGQNLISAAGIRATISQIESYNTAANTFREKYGYLPGDIPLVAATQFGLASRVGVTGEGDGNGIITARGEGSGVGFTQEPGGETTLFWVDLSSMRLIDGSFNVTSGTSDISLTSNPGIANMLPTAKVGRGNFFYAYSSNPSATSTSPSGSWSLGSVNFFGLSAVSLIGTNSNHGLINSTPALTVNEAYSIDTKIDDGLPESGRVQALYLNAAIQEAPVWAAGGGISGNSIFYQNFDYGSTMNGTPSSATTCYDNGGAYAQQHYSIEVSNGANVNCALSFQMQAGD